MTPEIAKKWLPIIQAVAEGKTLQVLCRSGEDGRGPAMWVNLKDNGPIPTLGGDPDFYRTKPVVREFWIIQWENGCTELHVSKGAAIAFSEKIEPPLKSEIIHVREVIDE